MGFHSIAWAGAEAAKAPAQAASQAVKEKVVLQVSDGDPKTWNQALNVVKNLQQAYGKDKVDIEVVAFGNGIGMLKMDSEVGNRVGETIDGGAKVYACQNTMRGRKLTKEDMLATVGYVPAGIVEIINKQREGWAVVRP
ncbi:MAG: DsrE family protein [Betaproteobacteria bacterium]|nr:DsrE family protein [Betaproteobacteria bacterium]